MWLKKKNIITLTSIVVFSFIIYQLYFFIAITSENSKTIQVLQVYRVADQLQVNTISNIEYSNVLQIMHKRSDDDKYINENGAIRGVLYANMARYRPDSNNKFKCLKSSIHIPFEFVNDDYCDCDDSSDEPSTNACVNGTFYCDTQYQAKPVSLNYVPSSMVNDGICDCCDGSDEWLHNPSEHILTQGSNDRKRHYSTKCLNICHNKN